MLNIKILEGLSMRFSILDCDHERAYAYLDKQTYTEDEIEINTLLTNIGNEVMCLRCFRAEVGKISQGEGIDYDTANGMVESQLMLLLHTVPHWIMLNT